MSNYHGFVNRLQKSRAAMFRVAEWLHLQGVSVTIPAIKVVPEGEDNEPYYDSGDIHCECPKRGSFIVEVKHLTTDFTGKHDWPHKETIVSNVGTVDRNWGKIKAYILVNKSMTHAIFVNGDTSEKWTKRQIFAKNTNKTEWFYVCPIDFVSFKKITE